ncbi:MAG: sulfite exporter TauE/SafE family protein [Deltaproteobacteria bacterium]|nr:sulfite exporter TauE/SafE family protein [Deltaproteobacteria bacterium]
MVFPVSGVEVAPWIPPLVAFVVSFFTSMGGVSGAFLLLPFQVSVLGFSSPAVSPTNLIFNIIAIPSGVYRYIKEGRMAWPLTWVVIVGTLPGMFIGVVIRIKYLPDPKSFKMFAGFVLLFIGFRLFYDLIRRKDKARTEAKALEERFNRRIREARVRNESRLASGLPPEAMVKTIRFSLTRIVYQFYGETFGFPTYGIFILSFLVGIVGGVYGIGGGAIIAPFFVAIFGLPIYTIAGATLAGTFITSIFGVIFYQLIAPFYATAGLAVAPDWMLGASFGVGGLAGMYCGARFQKFVPAPYIKVLLALIILFVALRYISQFFLA